MSNFEDEKGPITESGPFILKNIVVKANVVGFTFDDGSNETRPAILMIDLWVEALRTKAMGLKGKKVYILTQNCTQREDGTFSEWGEDQQIYDIRSENGKWTPQIRPNLS